MDGKMITYVWNRPYAASPAMSGLGYGVIQHIVVYVSSPRLAYNPTHYDQDVTTF